MSGHLSFLVGPHVSQPKKVHMEFYKVQVALCGDTHNTVVKLGVSVAEIVILREIHGSNAVETIEKQASRKVNNRTEKDRLASVYATATTKKGDPVVEAAFPGNYAQLPQCLADIEPLIDEEDEDEDVEPSEDNLDTDLEEVPAGPVETDKYGEPIAKKK